MKKRHLIIMLLCVTAVFINSCGIIGIGLIRRGYLVDDRNGSWSELNFTLEEFISFTGTDYTSLEPIYLADIDDEIIEGFIEYYSLSTARPWRLNNLRNDLDDYIERFNNNDPSILQSPYMVRELKNANSTEEEYLAFIRRFFSEIGIEAEFINQHWDGTREYEYKQEQRVKMQFNFIQTNNAWNLKIYGPSVINNYYTIEISTGGFMTITNVPFYLSKSGKYLLYFGSYGDGLESDEKFLEVLRTFTTMDDTKNIEK